MCIFLTCPMPLVGHRGWTNKWNEMKWNEDMNVGV
jgi:hypothetical protein